MAGSFAAGDSYSHVNTGCAGSITQTSASSRTTIKALWTPPAAGTGTVSLWSMMVISKNGNNYNAVLTVNEAFGASPANTATASKGASATATATTTATASAPTVVVHSSPASVVIANTGAGVTVVASGTSSYNLLAVGVGCAVGGAVVVAMAVVVVSILRRSQPKKIFTPTIMRMSPLQETNQPPNPYTV